NAIILHGTWDNPDNFWFPYIKEGLEIMWYEVWTPILPNAEKPNLKDWLTFVTENWKFNSETILIGHSAGSQLILSILEKNEIKIAKAILISGYAKPLPKDDQTSIEKDDFLWKKIRNKAGEIFFINSDNDPWSCDDKQGKIMFDNLGWTLIIKHDGHMGSTTYNQPYREFPLILKLCSDI
ncbi:MAG: putative esterase protein-like protein, partial [uncultured bacterium (gcode 4)]